MESMLAQYSLDEIQQLGQTIGGVIVAVLGLTLLYVCYRLITDAVHTGSEDDWREWMRHKYGENWENER